MDSKCFNYHKHSYLRYLNGSSMSTRYPLLCLSRKLSSKVSRALPPGGALGPNNLLNIDSRFMALEPAHRTNEKTLATYFKVRWARVETFFFQSGVTLFVTNP